MANTQTLDARIRERAVRELTASVKAACGPLIQLMNESTDVLYMQFNGEPRPCGHVLLLVTEAIVAGMAREYENRAVIEFMNRVDRLQGEVDELREAVR